MVMITYSIVSLILIPTGTSTDTGQQIMSVTAPPPLARHIGKKIRHDEAHRAADTHMRQFAPRRQAFDGTLGDGEEKGSLGWLQKTHGLCALWVSHSAAFRL